MNLGHRIFVVDGNSVTRIPQKKFDSFFFRHEPALPDFAGKTIHVAFVIYTLENRKPKEVVRIDCSRMRVLNGGELDNDDVMRGIHLSFDRHESGPPATSQRGNVLDATSHFNEREWRHRHPELSGPALNQILSDLF
jgi:hypothetical protein